MLVYEKTKIYLAHEPSRKEKAAIFLMLLNVHALVRALITRKFINCACRKNISDWKRAHVQHRTPIYFTVKLSTEGKT